MAGGYSTTVPVASYYRSRAAVRSTVPVLVNRGTGIIITVFLWCDTQNGTRILAPSSPERDLAPVELVVFLPDLLVFPALRARCSAAVALQVYTDAQLRSATARVRIWGGHREVVRLVSSKFPNVLTQQLRKIPDVVLTMPRWQTRTDDVLTRIRRCWFVFSLWWGPCCIKDLGVNHATKYLVQTLLREIPYYMHVKKRRKDRKHCVLQYPVWTKKQLPKKASLSEVS